MKEVFIERKDNTLRILIKKNDHIEGCFIEEKKEEPQIGEIYKGRIKNIIPAINSVFIDLGYNKEGYMYFSRELKEQGIKKGDEMLVQVLKEPLNDKGAKLTNKVSIQGKYLVLDFAGEGIEFSPRFKDKIKQGLILAELKKVDGAGLIVRTEGANVSIEDLKTEREALVEEYSRLTREMEFSIKNKKLYGDNLTLLRVLRDASLNGELSVIVNTEEDYQFVKDYLKYKKELKVTLYTEAREMFEYYGLEKEILKLRHNKVALPCGGNIVIEKTEAMYVIDVNSGKNIKERNFDRTILNTNVEAAREIGRQILLRNLSGIIVIDFIDMRDRTGRHEVTKELKEALKEDGGNVKIYPFTELNLIQISRKRRGKSIYDAIEEKCPLCNGSGNILRLSYIENLIKNEIVRATEENNIKDFYIQLDEIYKERVRGDLFSFLTNIDGFNKGIYLNFVSNIEGYHVEPLIFESQKEPIAQFKVKFE